MHSIFSCIWMYLYYIYGVFQCLFNIFQCIYSMFLMYFNVFECIYWNYNWNFTITFSLWRFCHAHPPTHLFSLYTMTPFPTCYTNTFLFFQSHWSVSTFIQSILTFHVYTSIHIPHFMSSLVAQSTMEPKFDF